MSNLSPLKTKSTNTHFDSPFAINTQEAQTLKYYDHTHSIPNLH